VEGKTNEMHMKEGELEKAKSWAQTVAEALSKSDFIVSILRTCLKN
jgi:hypothetical protein